MKKLLILIIALLVVGCDLPTEGTINVNPTVQDTTLHVKTYRVFEAIVDGVITDADINFYVCLGGYLYLSTDTSTVYSGADGVDDTCDTFEYDRHGTEQVYGVPLLTG